MNEEPIVRSEKSEAYWQQLNCRFPAANEVFDACITAAKAALSEEGVHAYIENGRFIGKMGRGVEEKAACRMALVRPITDDADIRVTLDHAIDTIFA